LWVEAIERGLDSCAWHLERLESHTVELLCHRVESVVPFPLDARDDVCSLRADPIVARRPAVEQSTSVGGGK
jgi:hypothetical protein